MDAVIGLMLEVVIYSGILFGAVMLVKRLLGKKISPVLQAALWLVLVARLCVPVTINSGIHFFVVPAQEYRVPAAETPEQPLYPEFGQALEPGEPAAPGKPEPQAQSAVRAPEGNAQPAHRPVRIDWDVVVPAVWIAGACAIGAWFFRSARRLSRLLRRTGKKPDERTNAILGRCQRELGIKRGLSAVLADDISTPAMTVSLRPAIVLPADMAGGMSDETLYYALRHELMHYKRKDHMLCTILRVLEAVWWFNPFVWLASREMRLDIESACDSMVVRGMAKERKAGYARTIVSLFSQQERARFMLGMAPGATKKIAERRVRGIFRRAKTKGGVKTAVVLLVAVLAVSCFTTACQPTPEKAAVVEKGNAEEQLKDSSENMDSGRKASDMQFPAGNYTYDTTAADGDLRIHVDAPVLVPETGKVPSAEAVPMDFTQEMVTGMFNYLFPGEKPVVNDETVTKGDIETHILNLKEALAKGEIGGEEMTEEDAAATEEEIGRLEAEYEDAPETKNEPYASDGTMTHDDRLGCYTLYAQSADYSTYFSVMTGFDRENGSEPEAAPSDRPDGSKVPPIMDSTLTYSRTKRESYQPFTMEGAVRVKEGGPLPDAAQGKLALSFEEAKETADGLFAAGGITDVQLFDAYVVDNHGTGHVDYSYDPASDYAYRFFYTRTLCGAPLAYAATDGYSSGGDAYDVPWMQEKIEITVAGDGITDIEWSSPCKAADILTEDADIIDFDTAVGAFEQAAVNTYAPLTNMGNEQHPQYNTIDVEIDSIRLAPLRIKQKDRPGEYAGVYVPAYVFYGSVKKHDKADENGEFDTYVTTEGTGSDFYPGPFAVFAVNAVDGSVIDLLHSY
ncbi:DUF6034 family protein [Christensenella intestinihominis]|uniref:DUF6034 family protein n=1 Tax=Christensenella intestinihominis TaxID=1851429 RepID=UPI0008338DCB|nr:DUF6034 family protein [Christensenella intestinihominis]